MRLDGLEHPKTYQLAALLGISRPTAIGHLELLWVFTGKHTPQGNIGKHPDGAIARACDWMGDPGEFIDALLSTGFLDECGTHRLIIHDWHEHCPGWVRAKLTKAKILPISAATPTSVPTGTPTGVATRTATEMPSSRARVPKGREGKGRVYACPTGAPTGTGDTSAPAPTPSGSYPQDDAALHQAFATVRSTYPAKGGRQHWIAAEHHFRQRIDEGVPVEQLLAGVARYAAFVAGGGVSGPQFVLGPEKFFGDVDRPWSQEWSTGKPGGVKIRTAADIAEELERATPNA